MKKYYKNITKDKAATVTMVGMLAIAALCIGIITVNHENHAGNTVQEEEAGSHQETEYTEEYIQAFLKDPQADIETRFTDIALAAFGELTTEAKSTEETRAKETEQTESKQETKDKPKETTKSTTEKQTKKKEEKTTEKHDTYTKKKETVYVVYDVNVRKSPNGEIIGGLQAGESVCRLAVGDNGWSQIKYGKTTAYVYTFYLCTNKAQITAGIETPQVQSASVQIQKETVSNQLGINITNEDYKWLLQIVQAEAGNQDEIGRILVANTIINRVRNASFPNTITGVIFQSTGEVCQFSPVKNGTIYSVSVDDTTKNCVNRALNGENYSSEVLYFSSEHSARSWHNTNLAYLFTHGDHAFYR